MDLRNIQVKPHWSREIFRRHRIPIKIVSAGLGLSYPHVVGMLSGSIRVTPENEKKLKEFCRELEEG